MIDNRRRHLFAHFRSKNQRLNESWAHEMDLKNITDLVFFFVNHLL